jgi:hypothetical protein
VKVSEIIRKAREQREKSEATKNKKSGKKRNSSEAEEQFCGIELFWVC